MRPLPKELQLIAEEELNEKPNQVKNDIKFIKTWIKSQPHLNVPQDDQLILTFLRTCKFSLERTKEKLDKYYTMRTIAPEFFSNRNPFLPSIQYSFKESIMITLPIRIGEPIRVIIRIGAVDPDKMQFEDHIKLYCMMCDLFLQENDNCAIAGIRVLLDLKGVTIKHVMQVTLPVLRKAMICVESAYPTRLKSIDIIHTPSIALPVCKVMKSFLSKKLSERISIYEDNGGTEIHNNFPIPLLPQEYGGNSDSIHKLSEQWKTKLESSEEWFQKEMKYCSDETKRPKNSKIANDLYGIDGSFRKLNID